MYLLAALTIALGMALRKDAKIQFMAQPSAIDISSYRSRNVRDVKLDDFDRIIALDSSVYEALNGTYPNVQSKLILWERPSLEREFIPFLEILQNQGNRLLL